MEVVGKELMALGMNFDNCSSLHDPIPGLRFSMRIFVELEQEGLDTTLVLDGNKASLEVLSEDYLLVAVSLAWCISAYSA